MSCGFVGTDREDVFEFEDDTTDDDVYEAWKEWTWEFIDGNYIQIEGPVS